jgi:hypothetical protein
VVVVHRQIVNDHCEEHSVGFRGVGSARGSLRFR